MPIADKIYELKLSVKYKNRAEHDDILDALLAAITAKRKSAIRKKYHTLPANPQKDSQGLNMEMVYWI